MSCEEFPLTDLHPRSAANTNMLIGNDKYSMLSSCEVFVKNIPLQAAGPEAQNRKIPMP